MSDTFSTASLVLMLGLLPATAGALPDDSEQPIDIDADSSEMVIDEGLMIYHGSDSEPAVITQGSVRIAGDRITVERAEGEVRVITVIGSPARFQQQPEVDGAVIHGRGGRAVYDIRAQRLTIEEDAWIEHEGNTLSGYHVEYDMAANRVNARSQGDDDRINMNIQPETAE